MGKRCQVCDGPIANGRCKYCGMPYRNDMELYHLNEDRSEHYRHASTKERKAMQESELPLPDRNKTVKKPGKTNNFRTQMPKAQTARVQTTGTKTAAGRAANTQTMRTYSTGQTTVSNTKTKKGKKGSAVFWIIVMVLTVAAGQIAENWDSIGYQIESFINDELGIDIGSFFEESGADEAEENDWKDDWAETISAAKSKQDDREKDPDDYMFTGEHYIVGSVDAVTEDDNTDGDNLEYEFIIVPGKYMIEARWEAVALEIKNSSGRDETVKFDEAGHQEEVELHTGDEISAVSLDGQDNYLSMYQIQQYDE